MEIQRLDIGRCLKIRVFFQYVSDVQNYTATDNKWLNIKH